MEEKDIEQTLVLIKPDALKNSLTGYILTQLSEFHTGLRYAGIKIVNVSEMLAEEHYEEHKGKVFFPSLLEYIRGDIHYPDKPWKRRVIALVYHGPNAIKKIRKLAGPTSPRGARDEQPGCIRALGTVCPLTSAEGDDIGERMDNLIHASANEADAGREIKLWFKPQDIPPLMRIYPSVESDNFYFYKESAIIVDQDPDAFCLVSPGNLVWKSDLEALKLLSQGSKAPCTAEAVIAKYLINKV